MRRYLPLILIALAILILTPGPTDSQQEMQQELTLSSCEDRLEWTISGGSSSDDTDCIEGAQGIRFSRIFALAAYIDWGEEPRDLTAGGHFTDDDFVCIAVYITETSLSDLDGYLYLFFHSDHAGNYYRYNVYGSLVSGQWNFIKVKRSDFSAVGSPSWASIRSIGIGAQDTSGQYPWFVIDDWRIVKASVVTIHLPIVLKQMAP